MTDNCDIIITTYNSEDRIAKTLDSLKGALETSNFFKDNVRVLFVNNASTDKTAEIAKKYQNDLPIEIIYAPEPGKSKAINLAFNKFVKSDIIILVDDDVTFEEGWLDNYINAIKKYPDYSVFAGRIVADWETNIDPLLASWIPMGSTFAIHENMESGSCNPGLVWGPNKAIRKEVLDHGIRYDERIGPTPKAFYAMGEDTALAISANRSGFKSFFVSDAIVKHTIKAKTANEDWVIRRAERLGYGLFAIRLKKEYVQTQKKFPEFVPLFLELIILRYFWGAMYPIVLIFPKCKFKFWAMWKSYYYKGLLKGYLAFAS